MSPRVLVVDDDPGVVLGVRVALETDGHSVITAADGRTALTAVAINDPDAIVLDLSMPGLDGLAVCRTLRGMGDRVPILVLTAHDRAPDRVAGLDAGADDYLGKPFDVDELLARVRALVRRSVPSPASGATTWNGLRLDEQERLLVVGAERIPLTRIETIILAAFFREPLRTRSREELVDRVWADEAAPSSNALEVYIAQLRRKLLAATGSRTIVTVRGLGYRIES